ncbi:MAG: LysM peptidoglycan-binding domain-containing protein [Candidatus Zixiibacteriota bacterium]|nr:MAG: LysM peptidoglycan-binding domain-containing protein [candidate division Zixibacteria bacterium]
MRKNELMLFSILAILIISVCSHPDPDRLMRHEQDTSESADTSANTEDNSPELVIDQTNGGDIDVDEAIDKAEYFYARGVQYFQTGIPDSAQEVYEQALLVLSELDVDPNDRPEQAARIEILLNEIEQDYRLALMSTGVLYSESSVMAFQELFDDLKNFKKLKESDAFRSFDKSDTIIYDIPIEMNERVENSLAYLQTVAREAFLTYLERSSRYMPIVEKILKEEELPNDIIYLPLVESGYNPHAYSRARAVGMWQFISSTGRLYGLNHNWWYDERRDFEKSTRAAAKHLKDLYERFGTWELALAAYNTGAGRVSREIRKKKTKDFWKLRLPRETRNYVPLFMAATIIAKQPEKYGFYPKYKSPLEYELVDVSKCISFNNISSKTGVSVADLELLNPELRRGVTPPDIKNYQLRIPGGYRSNFLAVYDEIPSEKLTNWVRHKIRRGETVSSIARRYGVSQASIVQANKLGRKKRIYAGKTLMIPTTNGTSYKSVPKTGKKKIVPSDNGKYRVRYGDTLWDIAVAHGVSVSQLKRINNLSSNKIYAGRILTIPGSADVGYNEDVRYYKYRVKRGDTLWKIASRNGTTVSVIKRANGLTSNRIYAGMTLMVPGKTSSNTESLAERDFTLYTIKKGDSLWGIAKAFNVTVSDLARWNGISRNSRLYPGDQLKIY